MRIVSGKLRGRQLKGFSNLDMRPTTERAREALFSSLQSRIDLEGIRVLDLFAGSGALGFEAISRGAGFCCFVERSKKAAKLIADAGRAMGVDENCKVMCAAVSTFIKKTDEAAFDLVLADPPYESQDCSLILEAIYNSKLVEAGSIVVFENNSPSELEGRALGLYETISEKKYGETYLNTFIVREV